MSASSNICEKIYSHITFNAFMVSDVKIPEKVHVNIWLLY